MTEQEYIIRKTVWEAFSNFYLDTELDSNDYDYISKILINSKIELVELKEIDLYEVFPVLQLNLLSPAGEWAGFDPTWLNENCLKNYKKRKRSKAFRLYTELKNKLHYWMRARHWKEIEKRIKSIT